MDKRTGIVAVAAILVIAFAAVNITGLVALPAADEEIRIGFIVAQTGSYAVGGEESLQGLLLAEKEINEKGGINGKKLTVIVEDNKSSGTDAVSAFRKLVNVDGVKVILGGQISGPSIAMAPVAEAEKALFFTTTATSAKLNDAGEYVFKFQAGNEAHTEKISDAMKQLGYEKMGLIYANEEYCKDQISLLKDEFNEKGIEAIAEELYETTATDVRTQLLKLQAVDPEAVYMCGYYEDQSRLLKQARELGIDKQFFAVTTIENEKFLEIAREAAEGIIYTSTTFNCDNARGFCGKYEQEFGEKATYRSAYLYDALYIVANVIAKVGNNPEALKEELLKTDFTGIVGPVVFDGKGNAKREFALKTVKDGEFIPFEGN